MLISMILYGLLGLVLAMSGVNIVDNTLEYISIMLLVVLIDVWSHMR